MEYLSIFFGQGTSWFWSMCQFIVITITLIMIYLQVRMLRKANMLKTLHNCDEKWDAKVILSCRSHAANDFIHGSLHLHEQEVSVRMHQQISFIPHVAAFFRGINMTVQVEFANAITADELLTLFNDYYKQHEFVSCQSEVPVIKQVIHTPNCLIGGFKVSADGKRATLISCLDNLLKGAASQAVQNINIALKLKVNTGLE